MAVEFELAALFSHRIKVVILEPPRGRFDPKKKPEPEPSKPAPQSRADIMKDQGQNADEEMHDANLEEEVVKPTGRKLTKLANDADD